MKVFVLILLFCGLLTHDTQVAYYKIKQEGRTVTVQFIFEQEEILQSLGSSQAQFTDQLLENYLNAHFSIVINGIARELSFEKMKSEHKHVLVSGSILNVDEGIHNVEINNTCLVDVEEHSNIIELYLGSDQRDFLMNRDRTSIQITY